MHGNRNDFLGVKKLNKCQQAVKTNFEDTNLELFLKP